MSKFFKITEIGKQRRKGSALCRLYNVLFLFLFFAQHIVAQRLTTQVFTKDDGLIGNELTHVFIDSKDRIWLSSYASGISIFNGKTFKNFSKQKFHNYSPGRIVEDKQGRVSIFEFDHNGFGRIEGDSMKVFYVPDDGVGMYPGGLRYKLRL